MSSNTKPSILVLAAAVLGVLSVVAVASGPVAKHVEEGEGPQLARVSAFKTSNRTRSHIHARPSAFDERSEAFGRAHAGQAGAGGALVPTVAESPDEHNDGEALWGDSLPEDRSMYASEPTEQFWQSRMTFSDEVPDTTWAEQLRSELTRQTAGGLRTAATFHQIDCRETICQLYLHTDDAQQAQAVIATMSQERLEVEHQQFAANVQLENAPQGGTTYEVVIRRERPASMPPHVAGAARAYSLAVAAREGIE